MRLACITVPNFRIALEVARAPHLAGRPIAIGDPPPGANQVLACSPEASATGIRDGMSLRDARTIAPDVVILPSDPVHYARAFERILVALEDAEPAVEAGDDGIAFAAIDPHADEAAEWHATVRLLQAVREATGAPATAGIAEGKFIAWCSAVVSAPGEAAIVPGGRERAFIAPLSAAFLPASYDTQRKLALYGLRTIGDVAGLPRHAAAAQFGREGARLHELACGIDRAPFVPRPQREPATATLQMPAPTVNSAALLIGARQLSGRLLQHPAVRYRQVRQARLRLALLGGGSWERTLTFREPLGDEASIEYVLRKLIEPLQLTAPVEAMALEFSGMTGEIGKQKSLLFAEQARRKAQLVTALRQLKTRFGGESQVSRVVEVEPWSRIPERRYALIDYDL